MGRNGNGQAQGLVAVALSLSIEVNRAVSEAVIVENNRCGELEKLTFFVEVEAVGPVP